jgi:hypothetical protein
MENDAMEPEYDRMIPMALKALHKRPVYLAYVCLRFCFHLPLLFLYFLIYYLFENMEKVEEGRGHDNFLFRFF